MAPEKTVIPEPANCCNTCVEMKKKCEKVVKARNALRQAVKLLEQVIKKLESENEKLKKDIQEEQARRKIVIEGKLKISNAMAALENEVSALKSEIAALQQKCGAGACEGNGDVEVLKTCISDTEKEINSLKEPVEKEKIVADSERKTAEDERKKAAEAQKLLEAEKKITAEIEKRIAEFEAEKAEEHRLQQVQLEREVYETKMKLASEVSKIKEATERFEAEKQKLLVEKRNAESEMRKAQNRVEVEKKKAEEQKKLAEDNWKRAVEAEHLADQMSQKLAEEKQTIEDLKQKINELSSLRKSNEMSRVSLDVCVNADNNKLQLLKNSLQFEKLRAAYARGKYKRERMKAEHEALRRSILEYELCLTKERGALQVTTSTKLVEENFDARPSMLKPSGRSIIEHDRMRKRINDTVECMANLSSEGKKINMQLANLLCGKMNNLQAKSDRIHTKRKKSHWGKADTSVGEKKETKEMKAGVCEDAKGRKHYISPASRTRICIPQVCRERMFDASNNFGEVGDGNIMNLLDLENVADEKCFRKAIDEPLSPFLPEIVDLSH